MGIRRRLSIQRAALSMARAACATALACAWALAPAAPTSAATSAPIPAGASAPSSSTGASAAAEPGGPAFAPPVVEIGVLAVLDAPETDAQWQALADGLSAALPHRRFRLRAMDPTALEAEVRAGRLAFVVTNPGHYVLLESRHAISRIATQLADARADPAHVVGSTVVARAGRDAPGTLEALRGRRVAAVDERAFGGYQVIAAEWSRLGVDAEGGEVSLRFTGFPMTRVVDAVLAGEADAGILRTCLLERLVREGRVPAGALVVVGARAAPGLDCAASSPLYPGWAFAALRDTPQALAREVVLALLSLPDGGGETRWSVPAEYGRVHEVLRALEVEPYAFLRATRLESLARRYWFVLGGALALLALGALYTLRVEQLVKRRTAQLTRLLEERDRLADQLARDREAMDHLSRLSILGELSATLGHEMNQPLATIANYASGLQRRTQQGALSEGALRQALGDIAEQAERAARILEGVRALARRRVGVRKAADPMTLVGEAVALFRGMLAQAPEIRVRRAPNGEASRVVVDPLQMQQVLLNLLKNALDAHRAGGVADAPIDVSIERQGDQVCIAVRDSGPRLSPSEHARLFEPFHTTKPDGLGLGLPICRTIVEAHGGALRARAADPSGARGGLVFEVLLPAADADAALPRERMTTS